MMRKLAGAGRRGEWAEAERGGEEEREGKQVLAWVALGRDE